MCIPVPPQRQCLVEQVRFELTSTCVSGKPLDLLSTAQLFGAVTKIRTLFPALRGQCISCYALTAWRKVRGSNPYDVSVITVFKTDKHANFATFRCLVCTVGFEPTTTRFQGEDSTRLSYAQIVWWRYWVTLPEARPCKGQVQPFATPVVWY